MTENESQPIRDAITNMLFEEIRKAKSIKDQEAAINNLFGYLQILEAEARIHQINKKTAATK